MSAQNVDCIVITKLHLNFLVSSVVMQVQFKINQGIYLTYLSLYHEYFS